MPDLTISFTDAQWARVVAATTTIKPTPDSNVAVDAAYLEDRFKTLVTKWVKEHEEAGRRNSSP